jgi:hypothetical protein
LVFIGQMTVLIVLARMMPTLVSAGGSVAKRGRQLASYHAEPARRGQRAGGVEPQTATPSWVENFAMPDEASQRD